MNQPTPLTTAPAGPMRVFLVEDSAAGRDLIVENLSDIPGLLFTGFADTEADALTGLNLDSYEVVIFDIELKRGNGISLLRSLTAAGLLRDSLKIIFINNVSTTYRRVGQQYGVQYFFDKSSELPELRALLQRLTQTALPQR